MYSRLRLAEKYLRYYLTAANGRGHGVHSPFVYDLVREVLCDRSEYAAFAAIEGLRRRLLKDDGVLEVEDMGAGARRGGMAGRWCGCGRWRILRGMRLSRRGWGSCYFGWRGIIGRRWWWSLGRRWVYRRRTWRRGSGRVGCGVGSCGRSKVPGRLRSGLRRHLSELGLGRWWS